MIDLNTGLSRILHIHCMPQKHTFSPISGKWPFYLFQKSKTTAKTLSTDIKFMRAFVYSWAPAVNNLKYCFSFLLEVEEVQSLFLTVFVKIWRHLASAYEVSMYPDSWEDDLIRPILRKEDIAFLLENTDFDEYDIREWFREFLKVII